MASSANGCGGVHVVSRRMVRPSTSPPPMVKANNGCHPPTVNGNGCHRAKDQEVEVIHSTPWDLRLLSVDYIQEGILLPKPAPADDGGDASDLVNALQSSEERGGDGTVSVFLQCTGEGAEFVHAVAPEVAAADIASSLYTPTVNGNGCQLVAGREQPTCLRKHFLQMLGLRADLPVHFIDSKRLTATDLNPHHNRFRLSIDAINRLRPLLTPAELHDANLFLQAPERRSRRKQTAELQSNAGATTAETSKKIKKPKAKGKMHGGLHVKLVDLTAGAKELLLSRWESGTLLVKGKGYLDFMRRCGFKEKDTVEIWAFVQRRFRIFGEDIYSDSLLHLLIVKKDEEPPRCCYCPLPSPSPPTVNGNDFVC